MNKFKFIMEHCKCSVSLTINDHRDMYESVEYFLDGRVEGIDKDILNGMIESDTMINCQFYPDTPIGFYSIYHYDLDKCLDICVDIIKKDFKNDEQNN